MTVGALGPSLFMRYVEFHFLYILGTDRKENATPLLCRCPAAGPKKKHHLPIVVAMQQPQNTPQS
jgi:hypothetical protein